MLQQVQLAAFSGELTQKWRTHHQAELAEVDAQRLATLGKDARRISRTLTEPAPVERKIDFHRPARAWLLEQLSEFQNNVRWAVHEWKGSVIPDDAEAFDDFCRQWPVEHGENAKDRTRRALEQLADLGLIAKVSLRNDYGDFLTGYRPLREEESSRLVDAERIAARLSESSAVPVSSET
jgi:type I restriction enzyme S subunit